MKVRYKDSKTTATAHQFNTHGSLEVIVHFDEGDATSEYISRLEVYFPHRDQWMDMQEAFRKGDLIKDEYNTQFFAHL